MTREISGNYFILLLQVLCLHRRGGVSYSGPTSASFPLGMVCSGTVGAWVIEICDTWPLCSCFARVVLTNLCGILLVFFPSATPFSDTPRSAQT